MPRGSHTIFLDPSPTTAALEQGTMWNKKHLSITLSTYGLLTLAAAVSISLPNSLPSIHASPTPYPSNQIRIYGVLRDFYKGNAQFKTTPSGGNGHYAGNLGVKQGLEVLLETAARLRHKPIRFLICGDGAQRETLAARAREMQLPNFNLLPLQAGRDYRTLLVDADLSFITQQAGAGNSFFPSKLLGLLAESKPVVTVAAPECELALSLADGNFGVNVPPGRPEELAALLDSLMNDPERLWIYGANGRRYVEQFEKQRVMQGFVGELKSCLISAARRNDQVHESAQDDSALER